MRHLFSVEFDAHPIELPPPLTTREKIRAAANTVIALQEMGRVTEITEDDEELARQIFADAREPSEYELSRSGVALKLEALLNEYDMKVVRDATQMRNYVTNKLIVESNDPDAKVRLRALEMLGKISDVSLFTEKQEITITHQSTEKLEKMLEDRIEKLISAEEGSHSFTNEEFHKRAASLYLTQP